MPPSDYTELREAIDTARQLHRRSGDSWPQTLRLVSLATLILGLTFSAGRNWQKIDELFTWKEQHALETKQLQTEYVRKDVLGEQFNVMNERLEALRRQVSKLEETINARRGRKE